jgi:cysteinyl-tRNA synthetase
MDLKFPHHECEIAQSESVYKKSPVNYWIHANMLTLKGKKMAKSTGNNILPNEMFSGENSIFNKPFSPMVVRFFMMQAHYRSIVDLSESALEASEKGFHRLVDALQKLDSLEVSENSSGFELESWTQNCYTAMNDDFNSPVLIAHLFDAVKYINAVSNGLHQISAEDLASLSKAIKSFFYEVLGLQTPEKSEKNSDVSQLEETLELLIKLRDKARANKDFETSDLIRNRLQKIKIQINDTAEGSTFKIN